MATIRQRRLVKGVVDGKSITQAAKDAGYSHRSAAEVGSETLRNPNVQALLATALEKAGITDGKLADTLHDALEATSIVRTGKDETEEHPDTGSRLKAVDIAVKIKGGYANDRLELTGKDGDPLLVPPVMTPDQVRKAMASYAAITRNPRKK